MAKKEKMFAKSKKTDRTTGKRVAVTYRKYKSRWSCIIDHLLFYFPIDIHTSSSIFSYIMFQSAIWANLLTNLAQIGKQIRPNCRDKK